MRDAHPLEPGPLLEYFRQPRKIAFIVNPKAGKGLQRDLRQNVDRLLDHRRFEYDIWEIEHPGHGAELAQRALAEGYQIVVAVGGDGTVNEVGSQLIGTEVALGILPAGSGNGLAMHLGYGRNPEKAVHKLNAATEGRLDVGRLNGHPFFNIAGIGFDGLVSHLLRGRAKRGFITYFLKSVEAGLRHTARPCRIEANGKTLELNCFAISVANGPMYGYNFRIAPDAQPDDGLFSVVILKQAPRWQYLAAFPASLGGKIYDADFVEHFTTAALTITSAGENYVHLDGESLVLEGPLHIAIQPQALKVLLPVKEG